MQIALALLSAWAATATAQAPGDTAFAARREAMVRLIVSRGVGDSATLAALRVVPRHEFVPDERRDSAYVDHPLPIGYGATISQPYVVGLMTAALGVRPGQRVLEVGTGSGYQAAVLATMGCTVYSIEIVDSLAAAAAQRLARLGYRRVTVRAGDGWRGWPEAAPFDAIIVTAAPDSIPMELVRELKRGGRMVLPLGPAWDIQQLVLVEKDLAGTVTRRDLRPVRFVPMVR